MRAYAVRNFHLLAMRTGNERIGFGTVVRTPRIAPLSGNLPLGNCHENSLIYQ
jgi:hypothetical protein